MAELDAQGQVVARFVYGASDHVPDYMIRAGRTYRFVADQVGSIRMVVDVQTGEIAQQLEYDEFGRVLADTRPDFQPFGFAAGLYDAATNLVRFGARDYDPDAGRWTAKDPVLFDGGSPNLYEYVFGNPTTFVDPSGLCENAATCGQVIATQGALLTNSGILVARNLERFSRAYIATIDATQRSTRLLVDLYDEGALRYPNLVGRFELHHIIPRYLGGLQNGLLVQLDASYHRMITTASQQAYAYRQEEPALEELIAIVQRVYTTYPIPLYPFWR